MTIFINDEKKIVESGITLSELINEISLSDKKGIALALNGNVIQKSKWSEQALKDNDKVLIISATRGG